MPRYVVLGAAGQLGREIVSRLPGHDTTSLTRIDADLSVPGQVTTLLTALRPKVVINCSAYNLVDRAEDEPQVAFASNAFGVRELALACQELGATLVHFSTDYVFGLEENRREPYRESHPPGPLSVYGLSKLTGEYFVRAYCPNHIVIRTCGLYGRHGAGGKGGNFVETMLKLARAGKTIKVVNDQILTPSIAADVAAASLELLSGGRFGLFHLTNQGECSWFDFASRIFQLTGVPADLQPTTTREYGSRAQRPAYSVLATEHSHVPRLRTWEAALSDYLGSRESGLHG
jgi:dTDP-4-dehydrorhamnose reductase